MNAEERAKAAAVRNTVTQGVNAADEAAATMAEAVAKWFKKFQEEQPNLTPPDPRLVIQLPTDVRAQIASLPIEQIRAVIREAYTGGEFFGGYFDAVLNDAATFDLANGTLQQRFNDINIDPTQFDPLRQQLLRDVHAQLAAGPIAQLASNRAARIISRALLTGRTLRETEADLAAALGGTLSGVVTLVSRDALYGYDGAVNDRIRGQYGLNAFRYVGSIVEDSRPHCRAWVRERVLNRDYLEPYIQRLHAQGNPDGFRAQTTFDNFAQYRGGWNCRHQAIPVRSTT
jgi:hypothetical protein